jgi:hypothetical protein
MFKTISAALVAASILAAPAFAATTKGADAPVIKSTQTTKARVHNGHIKMSRHHHKHVRHYAKGGSFKSHKKFASIKSHKRIGAIKTHGHNKVSFKHTAHTATKRG